MDDNGNGLIEYSEFMANMMHFDQNKMDDVLKQTFKLIDISKTGFIETAELHEMARTKNNPKMNEVFE